MKALKTLVAIALSATGLGSAVTLGVVSNNDVQPTSAAVFTGGEKLYLRPNHGVSFIRTQIPFMRAPPSSPKHHL